MFRFISYPPPFSQDVDNEHFIVWMRPAALPTFRKLYAVINTDLPASVPITITVQARFPTALFGGSKSLVVSTLGWTGGKNPFLGVAYLVVGSISCALALVFLRAWCKGRSMGNAAALVWTPRR